MRFARHIAHTFGEKNMKRTNKKIIIRTNGGLWNRFCVTKMEETWYILSGSTLVEHFKAIAYKRNWIRVVKLGTLSMCHKIIICAQAQPLRKQNQIPKSNPLLTRQNWIFSLMTHTRVEMCMCKKLHSIVAVASNVGCIRYTHTQRELCKWYRKISMSKYTCRTSSALSYTIERKLWHWNVLFFCSCVFRDDNDSKLVHFLCTFFFLCLKK